MVEVAAPLALPWLLRAELRAWQGRACRNRARARMRDAHLPPEFLFPGQTTPEVRQVRGLRQPGRPVEPSTQGSFAGAGIGCSSIFKWRSPLESESAVRTTKHVLTARRGGPLRSSVISVFDSLYSILRSRRNARMRASLVSGAKGGGAGKPVKPTLAQVTPSATRTVDAARGPWRTRDCPAGRQSQLAKSLLGHHAALRPRSPGRRRLRLSQRDRSPVPVVIHASMDGYQFPLEERCAMANRTLAGLKAAQAGGDGGFDCPLVGPEPAGEPLTVGGGHQCQHTTSGCTTCCAVRHHQALPLPHHGVDN